MYMKPLIILAFLTYSLLGKRTLKYRLTDDNGNLLIASSVNATETDCYSLTWIGTTSVDNPTCADYYPLHPCNPPFIVTTGPNANNGPNMTDVVEKCDASGSCNVADLYCKKNTGEVCIKYSRYTRSGEMDYFTSFCGKGVDTNWNGNPIQSGCYRQAKELFDVSVCFCEGNLCNSVNKIGASSIICLLFLLFFTSMLA